MFLPVLAKSSILKSDSLLQVQDKKNILVSSILYYVITDIIKSEMQIKTLCKSVMLTFLFPHFKSVSKSMNCFDSSMLIKISELSNKQF